MSTMLRPKFSRSSVSSVGRPSPRAADLTPEQQKQLGDAAVKIGGAIIDTVTRPGGGTAPPPPPPKKDHTATLILVAVVAVGAFLVLRRK